MPVTEKALVFSCEGEELVSILHMPESCAATGFVAVPAGSVQYRAGSGRQLVNLARALANQGFPVMRFDYRGMGDSSGEYMGFRHMGQDLERAIELFQRQLPGIKRVVLYGGCEAATGIMIHAGKIPSVGAAILANPWVGDERITAAAMRTHYFKRLGETEFWLKLFGGKYRLSEYILSLLGTAKKRGSSVFGASSSSLKKGSDTARPFQEDMLAGLSNAEFPILFLMSGGSLLRQEFDQLVSSSKEWGKAIRRKNCARVDLPEADQTFSTVKAKEILSHAILEWAREL